MRFITIRLIALVVVGLLAAPPLVEAQQAGKMPRIGYLMFSAGPREKDEAFFQGLRDLGWIEGENIAIEYRWAAFKSDRIPILAADLVRLKVDCIVVASGRAVPSVKQATSTIPIVMQFAADAVENGFVASLARPGGNVTGLTEPYAAISTKLLGLLHETLPKVTRVAYLWYPAGAYVRTFKGLQAMAPGLGLTIQSLKMHHRDDPQELASLLAMAVQERAGALLVVGGIYNPFGPQIATFAAQNRVPVFAVSAAAKKYAGLMSYTPDWVDMSRRAATYVDKVLKGAKPADLPVEQPVKYNLLINLNTARQLGITVPPMILYQATEIIR